MNRAFFHSGKKKVMQISAKYYGATLVHSKTIFATRMKKGVVEVFTIKSGPVTGKKFKQEPSINFPFTLKQKKQITMGVFDDKLCLCSNTNAVIYAAPVSSAHHSNAFEALYKIPTEADDSPSEAYICEVLNGKLLLSLRREHRFQLIDGDGNASEIKFDRKGINSTSAAVHKGALFVADNRQKTKTYKLRKFKISGVGTNM